jgi:hypothetical protein
MARTEDASQHHAADQGGSLRAPINPRVTAVLWSFCVGVAALVIVGAVASHVI